MSVQLISKKCGLYNVSQIPKMKFQQFAGMVAACIIKEIQVTAELNRMGDIGLVPKNVIDDLIKQKFEAPIPKSQDDDDRRWS